MRILLADDHDLVRETISAYLATAAGAEVSLAASLDEAVAIIRQSGTFQLILLDYNMPGMNGLAGLDVVRALTTTPVAILSGTATRETAIAALRDGASGFVPKTLSAQSLAAAVALMIDGEVYTPFSFLNEQSDAQASAGLTTREFQVLCGICEGHSNKEIARTYGLQEVTVKLHVKTLCRKLDARNRTHAAMIARDRSLI